MHFDVKKTRLFAKPLATTLQRALGATVVPLFVTFSLLQTFGAIVVLSVFTFSLLQPLISKKPISTTQKPFKTPSSTLGEPLKDSRSLLAPSEIP